MIRWFVFTLFGPFIGYLVVVVLGGGFKGPVAGSAFATSLPFAWIVGLAPAWIAAAADQLFERLGARSARRLLLTGLVGYACSYLLMIENYFEVEPLAFGYDWGLVGAVPAVACSALTVWFDKRRPIVRFLLYLVLIPIIAPMLMGTWLLAHGVNQFSLMLRFLPFSLSSAYLNWLLPALAIAITDLFLPSYKWWRLGALALVGYISTALTALELYGLSPKSGRGLTAEIKTGARRVIEFVLSPLLRYKQESLHER